MYDLGLTSEYFWSITPALFFALHERHKLRLKIEDLRCAYTTQILANVHRKADHPPYAVEDFMPTVEKLPPEPLEPEQIQAKFLSLVGAGVK